MLDAAPELVHVAFADDIATQISAATPAMMKAINPNCPMTG